MKKLFLVILLMPFAAIAQVDWHADPDRSTNVNSWFRRLDNNGTRNNSNCDSSKKEGTVTVINDGSRGNVWKLNKPIRNQRSELARTEGDITNFNHPEGFGRYYGWSWKIDLNRTMDTGDFITVWQWKTNGDGTQNYPINMEYFKGKLKLEAFGQYTLNSSANFPSQFKVTLAEVSVNENQWVDLVVRILKDDDPNKGFVEFWVNGVKQTLRNGNPKGSFRVTFKNGDNKRAYFRTSDGNIGSAQNVYPKWGAYNRFACEYDVTTYYDEMRVGRRFSEVDPAANNSSSSSGNSTNWPEISPGKYIWSSSQWSSSYQANRANDGNFNTWWASQQYYYNNNYIAYDLGAHYYVKKIKLNFSGAKMNKFRVWGHDGNGWFEIGVYNNPYTNPTVDNLNSTVRWISVQAIEQAYSWVDLYEFDVFGNYQYGKQENNKPDTSVGAPPAHEVKVLEKAVKVSPNPVSDNFSISLENIGKAEVSITDLLGKTVYKASIDNKSTLELRKGTKFKSGMYIISAKDEMNQVYTSKLIVK